MYIRMNAIHKTRKNLTREDWLDAAIHTLYESGIGSVSIVQLAGSLGVTRGSFYHHFTDREDLLRAMLKHWEETLTITVREEVRDLELPPAELLRALIFSIREHKAAVYDSSFRAWALHDPFARTTLERVDTFRLAYITSLFEAAGFKGIDAENRSRLLLYYEMADPAFFVEQDPETMAQLIDERLRLLLQQTD
ncbi:MAG TPA: TetR/AcrR family transcriptional regulator [Gammaproteobacteria bacterium]|nr:TetR/AcrR family transcriptional regulator [Gammaproteobacteria bacterium]